MTPDAHPDHNAAIRLCWRAGVVELELYMNDHQELTGTMQLNPSTARKMAKT